MTDLDDVLQLVRDQPVEIPDAAHREEVRTALLARAQQHVGAPRGGRMYMLALPLAAAAAGALWFVQPAPRTPLVLPVLPIMTARGHVHPHAGAAFDLASVVPDEIVKLHDGTIDLEVDPLQPHERFRVVVGASEIEVRGTAFSVTADHDHLLEVHVMHGRVEVRPVGDTAVTLVGGGAWTVPQITAVSVPVVAPAPPRRKPAPKPSADQLAYTDGWSALRQSRFDDAVVAFTRTIASDPDGVLADDARFWQAVALGRASRSGDAIVAFRALVDEHPGSSHSAEASVMLGWLLVDAKQLREARERFTAGVDDATASVRESARAGLAALARAMPPEAAAPGSIDRASRP
jgi:hypothetical protein